MHLHTSNITLNICVQLGRDNPHLFEYAPRVLAHGGKRRREEAGCRCRAFKSMNTDIYGLEMAPLDQN
jgi:hypothetical protein